jgi:hypothetical protein
MNGQREAVDFERIVRQMEASKLAATDWPTVKGGECPADGVVSWLGELDLSGMDVRIWSFTDHCTIGDEGPPSTAEYLERVRLFGAGGDLDVRRDGEVFRWRFVGSSKYAPEGDELEYPGMDESPVYGREREALLWGTREGEQRQWFDDRVAGAQLTYLPDPGPLAEGVEERVRIKVREYTQAGRPLAVWLLRLDSYREGKNG